MAAKVDGELLVALEKNLPKRVAKALRQGASPEARRVPDGLPVLHIVLEQLAGHHGLHPVHVQQHLDNLRSLLQYQADPNQPDPSGWIPLQRAARHGPLEAMQLLLKSGADPNATPSGGRLTPMQMAADSGKAERVDILVRAGGRWNDPAVLLRGADSPEVVEALLKLGADPGATDRGYAPLMFAAAAGSTRSVELLLSAGADVDTRDDTGRTALMWAVSPPEWGFTQDDEPIPLENMRGVVILLLSAGAEASLADDRGETAESLLGGYLNLDTAYDEIRGILRSAP